MDPELPRTIKPWFILMPWKYPSWYSRISGSACLVMIGTSVVAIFVPGRWFFYPALAFAVITITGIIVSTIQERRSRKKYMKAMLTLSLWGKILDGSVKLDDLPPEMQEQVAIERAKVYAQRPEQPE